MGKFFAGVGVLAFAIWFGPMLSEAADQVGGAGEAVVQQNQEEGQ